MKVFILALCLLLPAHATRAQAGQSAPSVSPQARQPTTARTAGLDEAEKLNESVVKFYAEGKYKEALPLAERVLALYEKAVGDEHVLIGNALNNLAVIRLALKDFGKAEPILERILARREKEQTQTSATTMSMLVAYGCLATVRGAKKRSQTQPVINRINAILLEDASLVGGQTPPEKPGGDSAADFFFIKAAPSYPREALSRRLQGGVLLMVEIDERGKIVSAEPLPCWMEQNLLAKAALDAALSSQAKPVLIGCKPIKVKLLVSYYFVIK